MSDIVLVDRMRASQRLELLRLLAAAVHQMTILGRDHYDDEASASHLRQAGSEFHCDIILEPIIVSVA